MIKLIKQIIRDYYSSSNSIKINLKEIEWAHIYHDSVRGIPFISNLSLNIGRWAGNYSFFYVLNRILMDYRPKSILEFGLGESTKMVTAHLENNLSDSEHLLVEHDVLWINNFKERNILSNRTKIVNLPLNQIRINGFESTGYTGLSENVNKLYDLYIIDGPFGSERYSRYDIISCLESLTEKNEFIILLDDTNRIGEQDTLSDLKNFLMKKNITYHIQEYSGNKSVTVICSEKYKFAASF